MQADLGIEHCTELKDMLAASVTTATPLSLDGDAVARVHTASLQLLAAWWRARADAARPTQWAGASEALRDATRTLGLDAALGLADHPTSSSPMERTP